MDALLITVLPAGTKAITPCTSQSPAVRLMLAALAGVPEVSDVPVVLAGVGYSPTLPAFALLFVVVPTMPLVCEGVKLPLAARVVKEPARLFPVMAEFTIAVVATCVVFVPAAAVVAVAAPRAGELKLVIFALAPEVAIPELQPNPDPFVHCKACAAPLQPVTVMAVGVAVEPVAFPTTVFAACVASEVSGTAPAAEDNAPIPAGVSIGHTFVSPSVCNRTDVELLVP